MVMVMVMVQVMIIVMVIANVNVNGNGNEASVLLFSTVLLFEVVPITSSYLLKVYILCIY